MIAEGIADITRELLTAERDRLAVDHYTAPRYADCDDCRRASLIQSKLDEGIAFITPDRAAVTPGIALDQVERRSGVDRRRLVIY